MFTFENGLNYQKTSTTQQYEETTNNQLLYQFHQFLKSILLGKFEPLWCGRYSKDKRIHESSPKVKTYRKWNAENKVDHIIGILKHNDILGSTQTKRSGIGIRKYKPFGLSWFCYEWRKADWKRKTIFTYCRVQWPGTVFKMGIESAKRKYKVKRVMGMKTSRMNFFVEINVRCVTNTS